MAELTITVDADAPQTYTVPVGEDLELPVTVPHGGQNILQFDVAAAEGELTTRNNSSVTMSLKFQVFGPNSTAAPYAAGSSMF